LKRNVCSMSVKFIAVGKRIIVQWGGPLMDVEDFLMNLKSWRLFSEVLIS
jgi:hypothetical protein